MPEKSVTELIDNLHQHDVYVSAGGFMEHVLMHPGVINVVDRYLQKCKDVGFDIVELSSGFPSFPVDDSLRLVERVNGNGLKANPELGIQFGAGGNTETSNLEKAGTSDPSRIVNVGKQFIDAGVERMMIEPEGMTENVRTWRTDVIQSILKSWLMESVTFEPADPEVFNWYIREFGIDVNLVADHSQIVQLTCLRTGIWGKSDTIGKIVSYRR